jgi:hypothetical protein
MKINTGFTGLVSFVVFTTFASSIKVDLGGISVTLPQFSILVLLIVMLFVSILYKTHSLFLFTDLPSLLIYSYFGSNLFSTIFFSINKEQSLKGCAAILTYVVTYVVVRSAMRTILDFKFGINQLVKANTISVLFGLICMVIAIATGFKVWGISFDHLGIAGGFATASNVPSIQSLSVEPNLFSILTACMLSSSVAIYLLYKKSFTLLVLIGLSIVSIVFSFTRSVYISLVISIFVMMFISNKTRIVKSILSYSLISTFAFLSVFFLLPEGNSIKQIINNRVSTLGDFSSGTGLARVEGFRMSLKGLEQNPLFGLGTLSANTKIYNSYTDKYQEKMGSSGWLNGALLQAIHDTGAIGFTVLLGIFISILVANYRMFKRIKDDNESKSILLGFIGGNTILFISSQLSSPLWISFPYVYWAVNMAFLNYCKEIIKKEKFGRNYIFA